MTLRAWIVAGVATATLGACGAGGNETAVRNAVNGWAHAVTAHDGAATCARLSAALRHQIERHLVGEGTKGNCNTWADRWVSPGHPASHRDARITSIRINGVHATVHMAARGVPAGFVALVRENGRWLVDNY